MRVRLDSSLPVLIADDDEAVLDSLRITLKSSGINNIICCKDSREILDILSSREIGIVLLDLTMPYLSGEELLPIIRLDFPNLPIVIITGNTEISTAVECMKMGAFDYLVKAIEDSKLIATVNRAIEIQELRKENITLKQHLVSRKLEHPEAFSNIVTQNEQILSILLYVEAIASTSQAVLITGETGAGKELIAKAIHDLSGRKEDAFLSVNVAGFDDSMFADTLFGHRKGAFTGAEQARKGLVEQAAGGTLFLDEIGDLNPASQVKLLRILETHEYFPLGSDVAKRSHARIIVATNRDMNEAIESGVFRKDLFYRLYTHHVQVPPLRERMDDLPLLINYFLKTSADELGKREPTPPPELYTLLGTYHFPGNIRELKSIIFNAVSEHKSGVLSLKAFKKAIGHEKMTALKQEDEPPVTFSKTLPTIKQATELLVAEVMKRAKSNQTIAAKLLGITPQALGKRLKKYKG